MLKGVLVQIAIMYLSWDQIFKITLKSYLFHWQKWGLRIFIHFLVQVDASYIALVRESIFSLSLYNDGLLVQNENSQLEIRFAEIILLLIRKKTFIPSAILYDIFST